MPQTKILIDTNVYLRLGQSISPLLGVAFGDSNYSLYLHSEIQHELKRSSRIQSKFSWIESESYTQERRKVISCSKKDKEEILNTYDFIWNFQKDFNFNISREDIFCISTALVLNITLVTDDLNMITVAKEFDVQVINTLELLRLMLDAKHIDMQKIVEIVDYWKYLKDIPGNFQKDFQRLFKI